MLPDEFQEDGVPDATLAEWVDCVADRFDAAWRGQATPRISDFLREASGPSRQALLDELIKIDLEYRCRKGERPELDQYARALPELLEPDGSLPDQLVRYAAQVERRFGGGTLPLHLVRCPHCGDAVSWAGSTAQTTGCQTCGGSFRVEPNAPADFPHAGTPRSLGKFQLLGLLGQGAFGAVYKAHDSELNRHVAIKIPRSGAFTSAAEDNRFLREAQHAARLVHPHIVPVHEIAREGDMPYIVSEYIEGQTLADLMVARRLGHREAADLLAKVAEALAYAHRHNVIHRDITPRNILLDASGQPHVTDFGLARHDDGAAVITLDGQILGTPAYMAPEQAAGESGKVDGRGDVYSLGVILYELLTGERPFRGNTYMLLNQVLHDEPRPPRRLNDRIPRDLETICLKAMAKAPVRRYANADDLAADLHHYLKGEPIRARPISQVERSWRWCRRNPRAAGLLGAVALSLLTGTGVSIWFAVQARDRAREAGAQAERSRVRFRMAREAVDQFHTQISGSQELRGEGLEPLRQKLLQSAADFYEKFVREEADDVQVQAEQGRAYWRLAELSQQLGHNAKAQAAYEKAVVIFKELADSYPDQLTYQYDLARSYSSLGVLYRNTGRVDLAQHAHQQALALNQGLANAHPESGQYQQALARSYDNLGYVYGDINRTELADQAHEHALAICRKLVADHPETLEYQHDLTRSYTNLGHHYSISGRDELAEQAFKDDLAISKRLAESSPHIPEYQQDLAKTYNNLAVFYEARGRSALAQQASQDAIAIRRRLADAHPQIPGFQQDLAKSYMNLGAFSHAAGNEDAAAQANQRACALYQQLVAAHPEAFEYAIGLAGSSCNMGDLVRDFRKPQEALAWYGQAIGRLEGVLQKEPRHRKARIFLSNAYGGRAVALSKLGQNEEANRSLQRAIGLDRELGNRDDKNTWSFRAAVLVRTGDHAGAIAVADKFAKAKIVSGRTCYDLACVYALASLAAAPTGPPHPKPAPAADPVDLLRKARDVGYFQFPGTLQQLRSDQDLDSLRSRDDFKKLLQELAQH